MWSKCDWQEYGKTSSIYLNLEKHNFNNKIIREICRMLGGFGHFRPLLTHL